MEDSTNPGQSLGQAGDASTPPSSPSPNEETAVEVKNEEDELMAKAQKFMEKITLSPDNPNPTAIHALASLLETHESLYIEENGYSSTNNARASHNVGRLGNLVRENDELFELISLRILSETGYPISTKAAAVRLLTSCSLTWIYPHVFEDPVLENIKGWVMDESIRSSDEECDLKWGEKEASDAVMLKTYSTGLLAVCLSGGGQVVEDVLTSGLSAKLMHYLRVRLLGESTSKKDVNSLTETKTTSNVAGVKSKDEARGRVRQNSERCLDVPRIFGERCTESICQNSDRDEDRIMTGDNCWSQEGKPPDGLAEEVGVDTGNVWHARDVCDGRIRIGDLDESGREDPSRCRENRGWSRSRVKGRANEGGLDNEQALTSPGSNIRSGQVRNTRERNSLRCLDVKKGLDIRKVNTRINSDGFEREDSDDCFAECKIGTKDISDPVRKAVIAAEAEARAANAPEAAIKAAGDAAAEAVKSAALEEYASSNDEDAAFLAASRAASTVVDAASVIEVLRNPSSTNIDLVSHGDTRIAVDDDIEEYFIPDVESLANLREKYCIQCLETLGEYVEALGPVLHERGVDVCLALLQRSTKHKRVSEVEMLLPDVMKLICALAAHRKFAALFVDRGGMLKLLAVPRIEQTFYGLSSCLFTIGSLQGIMERVCALPSEVVHQVVELGIQILECNQDQARKNAALFFAAAFVFRAIIDAFDAQGGLQKLLSLLNDAASVRSGVNSGTVGLSASAALRNERSPTELMTSSEKQIAYHTCVALRQYFRAHLLLLVDSIRPNKSNRGVGRNYSIVRAVYKPLDISNEAIDEVLLQLQKDRKLGPAFVKTRWPAIEKFLGCNGHLTMLEMCQLPPVDRYLRDLLQCALGVLHIVTLVPNSRKMIVNATLSNNRVGIAVILDATNIASSYVDPESIQPPLNVLVNLVCPPPSISNKLSLNVQGQHSVSVQSSNGFETRERNNSDRSVSVNITGQGDLRGRNGDSSILDRGTTETSGSNITSNPLQHPASISASGLVGDRRISLGAGAGSAGLAAQLEQGYCQARDAVRSNNGIKVLLHLLQPRIYSPAAALDCIRALACRVLLGLARDETIAHILTKLQVGKKLSELIRESGSHTPGTEQGRWQVELAQVAIELIGIITNSGRATTLAATDAATPTLRRIERAAIAAATPITYHSRELLQLIHGHLQASGLAASADVLLKEAQLTPLPSLVGPSSSVMHQSSSQETPLIQLQWPSGRAPFGFMSEKTKYTRIDDYSGVKCDPGTSSKKKSLVFSPCLSFQSRNQSQCQDFHQPSSAKVTSCSKQSCTPLSVLEAPPEPGLRTNLDNESQLRTPTAFPMKRKFFDLKDIGFPSGKRVNTGEHRHRSSPACSTPNTSRNSNLLSYAAGFCTPSSNTMDLGDNADDIQYSNSGVGQATPQLGLVNDPPSSNSEQLTLDSLVTQYLKHQHRQCPAPITTLPPLSLLQPHVCPEPKRSLEAPSNVTARLGRREFKSIYGGVHGNRKDRQFVYSRFRPWRTCRDDAGVFLSCMTFLSDTSQIAVGSRQGEIQIFDSDSNSVLESCISHNSPVTLVQSHVSGETSLMLSSSSQDVCLWDATSISGGPKYTFDSCKAARFSNLGNTFAALSAEPGKRDILIYDIKTCQKELTLSDTTATSSGRGHLSSLIHFSPLDAMLLWNGVLWDPRVSGHVHQFDQFTDYGGGGFHPAGNEVIINSEVWDLRKFRLLRSVPSLDQTVITFNGQGDVIYAILRRNVDDVMSAIHTRRCKHPLFASFRTLDAVNYSDIADIPVDRCVLDFAAEPTDSFVGLVTMDDQEDAYSSARVYEIGRRRPTDDDSDPDDAESEEDEDEDDDDDDGVDPPDHDDGDDMSDEDDDDSQSDDGEFMIGDVDLDDLDIEADENEDEDEDDEDVESYSSGEEDDYAGIVYGF